MTTEQKDRIIALRNSGRSYAEIAQKLGLGKSTVSNFCLRKGLNHLLSAPDRGNTVHAGNVENKSVPACKVTVMYAEKTDETSLAEALRILASVR